MKFKELLRRLWFLITVPTCISCGERLDFENECLCSECKNAYSELKDSRCAVCKNMLYECSCANDYLKAHSVKRLAKVFRYSGGAEFSVGNKLVFSLKQDFRRDTVKFLASELSKSIIASKLFSEKELCNALITSVPRRRSAILHYGYDHAKLLAKAVAKNLNLKYVSLFVSHQKIAQKDKGTKEERLKNIKYDYRKALKDNIIKGRNLIIIDDVVTTGASIGAAATLAKGLMPKRICAAAISISYRDKTVKFEKERYK